MSIALIGLDAYSVKKVTSGELHGTTELRVGKDAEGNFESGTFQHCAVFSSDLTPSRQASLSSWQASKE